MTLSRERRTKRKKNAIYRLINRICRINIVKTVKQILGDERNLPVSHIKNRPEMASDDIIFNGYHPMPSDVVMNLIAEEPSAALAIGAMAEERFDDLAIGATAEEPFAEELPADLTATAVTDAVVSQPSADIDVMTTIEAAEPEISFEEPNEAFPAAIEVFQEPVIEPRTAVAQDIEDVIVTPYGTFSRYRQESLLDYYESEQYGQEQKSEAVLTSAGEIIRNVAKKTRAVLLLVLVQIGRIVIVAARAADTGLLAASDLIGRGGSIVFAKIPTGIKKRTSAIGYCISEGLFIFIEKFDEKIGAVDERLEIVEHKACILKTRTIRLIRGVVRMVFACQAAVAGFYRSIIEYVYCNKRKCAIGSTGLLSVMVVAAIFVGSISAYEYSYNGKPLGFVKNQNDVYATVDVIGDKLAREYDANIVIDKETNISFRRVFGSDLVIDNREEVLNSFTYLKDMEVKAFAITVDGKQVAILDNKEHAESILQEIQKKFTKASDKVTYDKIGFAEDVKLKEVDTKLGNLQDQAVIMEYMLTGAIEKKKHVVQSGETFSGIAGQYGIKQSQLKSSNPDVVPDKLHIGQELILTAAVPVLTVQTLETTEYTTDIPYDIAYENTEAKYKGEQSVKSKGINGKQQIVAQIVRNNGIEVSRIELSKTVLSEPVAQVVLVGTKKLPPLIGTGTFINPVRGKITSRFGTRWGRMHEGIDIGARTGTSVQAADGGTVIYAGWDGAYGNVIRINHGGGKVSVYAHLSKILVKKGSKVFQGQHIGNVGSTGRSTGPHLHFEIRVNGNPKNPTNYI